MRSLFSPFLPSAASLKKNKRSNAHDLLRVLGDPDWAADPRNCPSSSSAGAGLLSSSPSSSSADDADDRAARLLRSAAVLLPLTLAASLAGGAAALAAFRHAPLAMAKAAVGAQMALPLVASLLAALNGFPGPALALALVAALTAAVFYVWRDRVELCARLLALASAALAGTPALVAASLASDAASLAAAGGLGLFAAAAAANGRVVRSELSGGGGQGGGPRLRLAARRVRAAAGGSRLRGGFLGVADSGAAQDVYRGRQRELVVLCRLPPTEGAPPPRCARRCARPWARSSAPSPWPDWCSRARSSYGPPSTPCRTPPRLNGNGEVSLAAGCFRFLGAILATLARGALAFLDYLTKFAVIAAAVSGRGLLASGKAATGVLRSAMLDAFGVW